MQFSRKFLIISIVALVAVVIVWNSAANGIFDSGEETATEETGGKNDKLNKAFESMDKRMGGKETPIPVEASPAVRGPLIQKVSAQGRVHAYQKVDVINEVSGKMLKLNVRDGDIVTKGQVIAEIDDRDFLLDVQEARRNYLAQKAEYAAFDETLGAPELASQEKVQDELKALEEKFKQGLLSEDEYRRQKFNLELQELRSGTRRSEVISARTLEQAEINLQKAELTLEKCQVRAPFDGMIFGVEVSEGAMLNPSTVLAKLYNLKDLAIKTKVLESEIGQVSLNRPAKINFTALPDLGQIEGEVRAISPFINEEDKTVDVMVGIKRVDNRIRPGMFAEVKIDSKIYEDRLMVPKTAILPRDDRKVVFKVSADNRAKWLYVETGVENDEFVEITKGELAAGELVLTDNHFTMGHDTLVKVSKN